MSEYLWWNAMSEEACSAQRRNDAEHEGMEEAEDVAQLVSP